MILREVVLHNYGPYGGRHVIDLSPTEAARPIVLVGALNGGGKTSLLDGLQLALYGNRARCSSRGDQAYPDFLRSCIHTRAVAAEGAAVSVTFDYVLPKGAQTLRVDRRWRVAGQGISENLVVYRNGEEDPDLSATWAERVEDMLPLGISTLFFFDGEMVKELADTRSLSEEVRQAIRTLLGLELPHQLKTDLSLIAARKRRASVVDPQAKQQLEVLRQQVEAAEVARATSLAEAAEAKNTKESLERRLERAREAFAAKGGALVEQRPRWVNELARLQAAQKAQRDHLREVAAGTLPLALASGLLHRALARAEVEVKHGESAFLRTLLEGRDAEILAALREDAESPHQWDAVERVLRSDRARRTVALNGEPYLNLARDEQAVITASARELAERVVPLATDLRKKLMRLDDEISRVEAKLAATPDDAAIADEARALRELERALEAAAAKYEARKAAHELCEREAERAKADYERKSRDLHTQETAASDDQRIIRTAERVTGVIDEYTRRLRVRKLHELERNIAERFSHLARKEGFVGRVVMDPETFELKLYDPDGLAVTRMSAGEQQLLAIAFLWGLALSSGRHLPVVIDTPLGRMDHTHRRNLIERYFPHASHQVVLLSTDAEIDPVYRAQLFELDAIDREYRLDFDPRTRMTSIRNGYFEA